MRVYTEPYRILDKEIKTANGKDFPKVKVNDNGSYISLDIIPELYEHIEKDSQYKFYIDILSRYDSTNNRVYQVIKIVDFEVN